MKSVIASSKKAKHIGSLQTSTGLTYKPKEIAQGFADYFRTAVVKIRQTLPSSLSVQRRALKTPSVFRLSEVPEDFVCSELKKVKSSKSTGLENIPARLLKDGASEIVKPLTILINRSLAEGAIPSDWKHAVVTPIHKAGTTTDAANYRPISTLPVFAKLLERAAHNMVYSYLQDNSLLTNYQSEYRPLHSTSTCLIDVTNSLLQNIVTIIEGKKIEEHNVRLTLRWPNLEARRKYQTCLQVFKCINGLAPAYLLNQFTFSREFHSHDTRYKDLIHLPVAKTSKFQSSFKYHGAKEWNSLPSSIRNELSLPSFKMKLKNYLCYL